MGSTKRFLSLSALSTYTSPLDCIVGFSFILQTTPSTGVYSCLVQDAGGPIHGNHHAIIFQEQNGDWLIQIDAEPFHRPWNLHTPNNELRFGQKGEGFVRLLSTGDPRYPTYLPKWKFEEQFFKLVDRAMWRSRALNTIKWLILFSGVIALILGCMTVFLWLMMG